MVDEHPDDKHIYHTSDGWFFWDEAGVDFYGPYETKELAREGLDKYAEEILESCRWVYYDGWNSPCHANEPTMDRPEVCPFCKKKVVDVSRLDTDFGNMDQKIEE